LPQYGFHVRVPGPDGVREAAVERRDGKVVEWSRSPSMLYFNGRGSAVDFEAASAGGAIRIERQGEAVTVTPAPGGPALQVRIHWGKLPWTLPRPREIEALREDGSAADASALRWDGDDIPIECAAGVFAYRLK